MALPSFPDNTYEAFPVLLLLSLLYTITVHKGKQKYSNIRQNLLAITKNFCYADYGISLLLYSYWLIPFSRFFSLTI